MKEYLQIIGNDRLFGADPTTGLYIYEIPDPDITEYTQAPSPLYLKDAIQHQPLWYHRLRRGGHWGYSRLYFDGSDYRQVISTCGGIFGVVIPASPEELPRVLKLADFTFDAFPVYGLGLYKGYAALQGDGARFGYSWDNIPSTPTFCNGGGSELVPANRWFRIAFDEETGCFIGTTERDTLFIDFHP